jgi:FOG: TPR repeat, SEL1 subfamily
MMNSPSIVEATKRSGDSIERVKETVKKGRTEEQNASYLLFQASDQGNAEAQYSLAVAYAHGHGIAKDLEQAFHWYGEAAKQGHAKAQYSLAAAYAKGDGIERDFEQAFHWYGEAAKQGLAKAQYYLGGAYFCGRGIERDFEQAFHWFSKAAKQGLAEAQYILAAAYEKGYGIEKNLEQAFHWYHEAAKQGHAEAQYSLAVAYSNGYGIEKDSEQASYWYHEAAKQGHAKAQYNLGVRYVNGHGVEKDHKAAFWYSLLAKKANPDLNQKFNALKATHRINILPTPEGDNTVYTYDLEKSPLVSIRNLTNSQPVGIENLSMRLAKLARRSHGELKDEQEDCGPSLLPLFNLDGLSSLYNNVTTIQQILEETLPKHLVKPGFLITNLTFGIDLQGPKAGSPYMRSFTLSGQNYLCLGEDNVKAAKLIANPFSETVKIVEEIRRQLKSAIKGFDILDSLEHNSSANLNKLRAYYQEADETLEDVQAFTQASGKFIEENIRASTLFRNAVFKQEFDPCFN